MEEVEFNAKICMYAKQLNGGSIDEIPCEQLEKLMELRKKFQLPGRHPGCKKCANLGTEKCRCKENGKSCTCGDDKTSDSDLVAAITRKVLAELGK